MSSVSRGAGVANVVMAYYRHIDKTKFQFDFLIYYRTEADYTDEITALGGNVYVIPKPGVKELLAYKRELIKILEGNTFAAVHLHELYMNGIIFPVAKKCGIKKCIAHSHTTTYSENGLIKSFRNRLMFSTLRLFATDLFACGLRAAEFAYGRKELASGNIYIMSNAIELNKYQFSSKIRSDMREKFDIKDSDIVLGHVGRFTAVKNHDFLIELFKALYFSDNRYKLLLVGSGERLDEIKEIVRKENLEEEVVFLGNRDDVPALLQAMDIFLLPSLSEALPIVSIEAQASGLRCIVSDTISKEIDIQNVSFINLNAGIDEWCEQIKKETTLRDRTECVGKVRQAGYDICQETKKLEEKYGSIM